MKNDDKLLSYFLGPKAENANFLEEIILLVLRDYFHWRRNYFPGDKIIINKKLQRELENNHDILYQNILELTAELRRNFPFYSTRYIAHMLSDTLIPSMVGYFAGMLYNPNNVTPEAAPVTVDMEIEACNTILDMLGFTPPPTIPNEFDTISINNYKKELQKEFGWAHLTQGGTIANIEALWIARAVKYTPLSIWDVAKKEKLDIDVKMPDGSIKDIKKYSRKQILYIKPNEAIYLLARFVEVIRDNFKITISEASEKSQSLLNQSDYSLNKGYGKIYQEFPPVVFVSGMAHYSINKAVDILGMGKDSIQVVKSDSRFRMDIQDLEQNLNYSLAQELIPLAVIPILGTTEEGSVDPVHKILDLRENFENNRRVSFWVHVDAAWGGYIRSLFNLTMEDCTSVIQQNITEKLNLDCNKYKNDWDATFFSYVTEQEENYVKKLNLPIENDEGNLSDEVNNKIKELHTEINRTQSRLEEYFQSSQYKSYLATLTRFIENHKYLGLDNLKTSLNLDDRIEFINSYISDEIILNWGQYKSSKLVQWGDHDVCSSFLALSKSDSITIDPHKMGYVNYPCGMVTYKNDRVRHFVLQKAPYITSVRQDVLIHMPPKHIENFNNHTKVVTEAFAPFIIDGSRPGAAATALWTTIKTIPLTTYKMGSIIKSSLIAARELYEWLVHWDKIMEFNKTDTDFEFIPFTPSPPDLNVVIFGIKKKTSNSLSKMNLLTQLVYENFSIQSELGEREYSYSQSFFLSKTNFQLPLYSFDTVRLLFEQHFDKGHIDDLHKIYNSEGLVVLRATVMNPYIKLAREISQQYIIRDFMKELDLASRRSISQL